VQHKEHLEKLLEMITTGVPDNVLRQQIASEATALYNAERQGMESMARINKNYIPMFVEKSVRQQLQEKYPLLKPAQQAAAQQITGQEVTRREKSSYFRMIAGVPMMLVRYLSGNNGNYLPNPQVQEVGEK